MKSNNITDIIATKNRELKEGVLLYILEDGKQVVFKPGDIRDSVAEVIAYRLSLCLGFPNVPETKLVKIDGNIGSIQDYIEGDASEKEYILKSAEFDQLKIFAFIFGQWDLSINNIIIDGNNKLYAIDNANIWNQQHVQSYGKVPFVACNFKLYDSPAKNKFPFYEAKDLNKEEIEKIQALNPDNEEITTRLTKRAEHNYQYVVYQNKVYLQEQDSITPYAEPDSTATERIKTLNKSAIEEIVGFYKTEDLLGDYQSELDAAFGIQYIDDVVGRIGMVLVDHDYNDFL